MFPGRHHGCHITITVSGLGPPFGNMPREEPLLTMGKAITTQGHIPQGSPMMCPQVCYTYRNLEEVYWRSHQPWLLRCETKQNLFSPGILPSPSALNTDSSTSKPYEVVTWCGLIELVCRVFNI